METLGTLFDGSIAPGTYRLAGPLATGDLLRSAARHQWQGWQINGATIASKAAFLDACARAMRFPAYFGRNWDAFEECITDLAWQPAAGYLLIYENPYPFARRAPRDWQTALDILAEAAAHWHGKGRTFYTLLRRTGGAAPQLPLLRALA